MRLCWLWLAVLGLLVPALATGQAQTEPQVVDAPDDARDGDAASHTQIARSSACRLVGPKAPEGCRDNLDLPHAGGDSAPATMEAISATFSDTPGALVVELELASVDPSFPGAVHPDGTKGALYSVCWTTSGLACSEAVVLAAIPTPQGAVALTSLFEVTDPSCNDAQRCAWRVPHEIVPGSPGRLRWSVPRAILPNATEGTQLSDPMLSVVRYLSPTGRPAWPSEDGVGYGWVAPNPEASTYGYTANHRVLADASEPGSAYVLATPMAAVDTSAGFAILDDSPGDVVGDAREDIDILALRLEETAETFTVAIQVASVEATPGDHYLYGAFSLPTGRFYTWGYAAHGGVRSAFANVCGVPRCQEMAEPSIRDIAVNITATPGAPGWIHATFSRDELERPPLGALVSSIDVTMFTYDERATQQQDAPVGRVTVLVSGGTDTLAPAPPWWFRLDSRATVTAQGLSMHDDVGDVASATPLAGASSGQFDLTYVDVVGISPTAIRVTLGVRDLASVGVPSGASAVFYGAALELDDGRRYMAGFHRQADTGAQAGAQTFLCAADASILEQRKLDPIDVVHATIEGNVASRGAPTIAASSQGGAIMLFVPYTCFGEAEARPLHVKVFAAGAYVVRPGAPAKQVEELDFVLHDGGGVVSAFAAAVPRAPWYAEPFGIQGFWDVFGLVTSVVAGGAGIIAVRRKRQQLKHYLAQIEHALAEHASSPSGREKALLAIRHRLKDDVINSNIDQAHYALIDKRLDEALATTRVATVAETFEDLPHRLLKRLQDLLVDGRMSGADYRVFSALLDETELTSAAKARVRRKLEAWVREDVDETQTAEAEAQAAAE